ncbi:cell division protein FtsQ/DivIB [Streptomyces diastatochromogenes]|uniref:Cell division protein FtsQ n=1 Tax=Streptomyces diastatochromogenes TaxID=42236 RepID=A0A233S6E4_STRDA|nr:FtsQ-type POTRA domain-containing protein [Streptomyces diastatochromogenes]MCZ0989675.1 FtsQ-type POTRA domain-containing protein [Streptomyces diastatochromogenes]OXY91226.1 cell division protein FtsQ [Streptomyces diastatochromogenes]
MAGPTTAERGERQQESSGPPPARRLSRPRLRTIVILTVALVLLGAGSAWALYGSSWLRVRQVSVTGTRVLTPADVREVASVPVGDPMISVDTDAIEARLRRKLPRIDTVDVVRSWPHGIGLKVVERTPVLLVRKAGNFVEVDDEGVRFATVSQAPKGVPTLELTASRSGSGSASFRRFGTDRLVREAVQVAGDLPAAVARDTRTVQVRSYDDISLELGDGRTVAWGSGGSGRVKARALTALMKAAPGARHFDVSVPTAPASSGS